MRKLDLTQIDSHRIEEETLHKSGSVILTPFPECCSIVRFPFPIPISTLAPPAHFPCVLSLALGI